jgi:hypothetical protein
MTISNRDAHDGRNAINAIEGAHNRCKRAFQKAELCSECASHSDAATAYYEYRQTLHELTKTAAEYKPTIAHVAARVGCNVDAFRNWLAVLFDEVQFSDLIANTDSINGIKTSAMVGSKFKAAEELWQNAYNALDNLRYDIGAAEDAQEAQTKASEKPRFLTGMERPLAILASAKSASVPTVQATSTTTPPRKLENTGASKITPRRQAILYILGKLKTGKGLEGKEIVAKLPKRLRKSESTLRRHDFPVLKDSGLIQNTPGIGYHLTAKTH